MVNAAAQFLKVTLMVNPHLLLSYNFTLQLPVLIEYLACCGLNIRKSEIYLVKYTTVANFTTQNLI